MHDKKRAAGASVLAAATILSGLGMSAPPASAATADGHRDATTFASDGLWIREVTRGGVEKYVVLDGTAGPIASGSDQTRLLGHEYATLADAVTEGRAHNWDQWVFPATGTWGQIRFGANSCVYGRAYYVGTSQPSAWTKFGALMMATCSYPNSNQGKSTQINGTWQVQSDGSVRNQWDAAFTGITSVPNRPAAAVYLADDVNNSVFWQSGPDSSVGPIDPEPPATNGGVDANGVGFDLSLQVGETKDLFVGQAATGSLTELHPATYTITAPAGTKFASDAKAYAQFEESAGAWADDSHADVTTSVNAAGDTATVTITTKDGWLRAAGERSRFGIPLTATAAGTGTADFSATGTTNLGTFSLTGSSNVTVTAAPVTAPENNGFDTDGAGFSATVEEGETVDVPFGLTATGDVSQLTLTDSELTAPAGTEFVSGTTTAIAQVKRAGSNTWSPLPAADAAVTVSGTKKSATVSVTDAAIDLADGDTIRWSVPVKGLTEGADKQIGFTTTGTTNWGTFDASGSSTLTVTAPSQVVTPAITSGPADNADTPASITYTGTAQSGSRVQIFDGNGTLKWSTTVQNGTWSAGPFSADTTKDLDLVFKNIVDGTTTQFATRHLNGAPAAATPTITSGPADNADTPASITYTGTAQSGSRVQIFDGNGTLKWSTTVQNGTWSAGPFSADTTKDLDLVFKNIVDGTTTQFATRHLTGVPAAATPTITSGPADNADTPASITYTGTAQTGSRVQIFDGNGTLKWSTTVKNGTWSAGPFSADTTKDLDLVFKNIVDGTTTQFATRHLTGVVPPIVEPVIVTGPAEGATVPATTTYTGTAATGSRIAVTDGDGNLWFSTTVKNGTWSISRITDPLKPLELHFANVVNGVEKEFAVRHLQAAIVAPTITSGPADGSATPATGTFTGTASKNTRIIVKLSDGTTWFTTRADAETGIWSFSRTMDQSKSYTLEFYNEIDGVQTKFATRTLNALAKITSGPADQSENTGEIGFSGTAVSGSQIQARLVSDNSLWFSTTAQNGQWSFSRLWDKNKGLDIRFVNIIDGKEYEFDTRTIKPATPAVPAEITSGPADGSTVDPTMSTFSGRGPVGQRIWVYDADNGNTLWWDTTIKGDNTWKFTRTLNPSKNYHLIFKAGTTEATATQFAERTLHAAN